MGTGIKNVELKVNCCVRASCITYDVMFSSFKYVLPYSRINWLLVTLSGKIIISQINQTLEQTENFTFGLEHLACQIRESVWYSLRWSNIIIGSMNSYLTGSWISSAAVEQMCSIQCVCKLWSWCGEYF